MVWIKHMMVICGLFILIPGCTMRPDQSSPKHTNGQWLEMVRQRQHQPVLSWRGISTGSISDDGAGCGICGMQIDNSPAYELEEYVEQNLEKTPLFLLPLMAKHENSDIVLTGLYVYNVILSDELKRQYKTEISDAFRGLLSHRDSSVRATAFSNLQKNRWLIFEDIEKGLNDEAVSVAFYACSFGANVMLSEYRDRITYDEMGNRISGSDQDLKENIQLAHGLVSLMLDHLNDTHYYIRSTSGAICRRAVRRSVKTENGRTEKNPPNYPDSFDWMRSSYAERVRKQKEWKQWWADHGEECLKFAYPDAPAELFQ